MKKPKKAKMGRPIEGDEPMSETIRFRATKTDRKRLQKAADRKKAELSDFIRDAALKRAGDVLDGD